ncbi:hypothetical protein C8F01DRAFT_1259172 [Mycena amicta]|nr:hypothetical protein C8F01DRAFT_1259172 [Mycena amicta]
MSSPPFTPIGSFVLPPGSSVVQAQPSEVQPFIGPIPADLCLALLYEQGGGKKLVRVPHKTAHGRQPNLAPMAWSISTPIPPPARTAPGPSTPTTTPASPSSSNVPTGPTMLIPSGPTRRSTGSSPTRPCTPTNAPLGNVVVLKHHALGTEAPDVDPTHVEPAASTVYSAPLANVTPEDVATIDGYVLRALSLLAAHQLGWRYFVQYEAAERLHWSSGKDHVSVGLEAVAPGPPTTSATSSTTINAIAGSTTIIASVSIVSIILGLFALNAVAASTTANDPSLNLRSVYVQKPTGTLTCRAEAASAQHTPGGTAIALRKNKRKCSSRKYAAYAVIRGHEVGVQTSWAVVQQQIANFRFALQLGCKSVAEAQALVDFASAKGWTSASQGVRSRPVSRRLIPGPCTSVTDLEGRPPRKEHDPWYICYVGVNPGVYSSYLECALNTLGVSGNVHDHRDTFDAAVDEFMWAQVDGHVVARDS